MSTPSHRPRARVDRPTRFVVGAGPPTADRPGTPTRGKPRLRTAKRGQVVLRAGPLDATIPEDHPARIIGAQVEGLDLAPFYDRIRSVERGPGRAPIDRKVLVGVDVIATGGAAGRRAPMVGQVGHREGAIPPGYRVDGGIAPHDRIDAVSAAEMGGTVSAPVPAPRGPEVDRHAPKPGGRAAVAAWRRRMATAEAEATCKGRAATAECVNALARGRGLLPSLIRGLTEVRADALWHASAHNLKRSAALGAAAARTTRGG